MRILSICVAYTACTLQAQQHHVWNAAVLPFAKTEARSMLKVETICTRTCHQQQGMLYFTSRNFIVAIAPEGLARRCLQHVINVCKSEAAWTGKSAEQGNRPSNAAILQRRGPTCGNALDMTKTTRSITEPRMKRLKIKDRWSMR